MKDEFTPTVDYVGMFSRAAKNEDIRSMIEIFQRLCGEIGIPDQSLNMSSAASGERLAKLMNDRDSGAGGKKL